MGFLDTSSVSHKKPSVFIENSKHFFFQIVRQEKASAWSAVNGLSAFNWNDLIKRSDENKKVPTILCNEQDQ